MSRGRLFDHTLNRTDIITIRFVRYHSILDVTQTIFDDPENHCVRDEPRITIV
jgi:hypothetical protein